MKLSVVLLNWKGFDDTAECIESLSLQSGAAGFDIVVVDNDSGDGSPGRIEKLGPDLGLPVQRVRFEPDLGRIDEAVRPSEDRRLVLIESATNLGFCGGNNLGAQVAFDAGADGIVVLNNDTTVAPDFLAEIGQAHAALGPRVLISPLILYADEPDTIWWNGGTFSSFLVPRYRDQGLDRSAASSGFPRTDWVSGCATLVSRELFESIGLYDEDFFIWCEEWDLSLRAASAGVERRVASSAIVWHKVGRSLGLISPLTFFYSMRNMRMLRRRHLGLVRRSTFDLLSLPRKAFQASLLSLRFRENRFLLAFVDALLDNQGGIWHRQAA